MGVHLHFVFLGTPMIADSFSLLLVLACRSTANTFYQDFLCNKVGVLWEHNRREFQGTQSQELFHDDRDLFAGLLSALGLLLLLLVAGGVFCGIPTHSAGVVATECIDKNF